MSASFNLDVLRTLHAHGPNGIMTYVIANWLSAGRKRVPTSKVRRALERMERAGSVKRVPSVYSRQICWAVSNG